MTAVQPSLRPCIRSGQHKDIDQLLPLLEQLFLIESDFCPDRRRQRRGLELLLDAPDAIVLVAVREDRIIGMCSGQVVISTAEGGPALLVEDMVVDRAQRGQGIGRLLLQHLTDQAASRNISRLQLLADLDNSRALDFYQRQGWQRTRLLCLRTIL